MNKVGLTTSAPIELVFAAGYSPVDLNNVFIVSPNKKQMVEDAEMAGFPSNLCTWIKGIYSAAKSMDIETVIGITQGDCSNTHALMEVFDSENVNVLPFAYPYPRNIEKLNDEIENLAKLLGTSISSATDTKKKLDKIRGKIAYIDRLTWEEGKVSGFDNHIIQVSSSDMKGDFEKYEKELDLFIAELPDKSPYKGSIRLGYMGVPTIIGDLYPFLESLGCSVVYNEVQRQFSMPQRRETLAEQYFHYTYPYGIQTRLDDIQDEIKKRNISGIIHYVQSFCFRQIEDILVKNRLGIPVLLLEGNMPENLDGRLRTRIEGFVEMLHNRQTSTT